MKQKHSKEFKEEAIKLTSINKTIDVARDLGINANMLSKWKRELEKKPFTAFNGKGTAEQERIKELEKQLSNVTQQRDILKKAIAIFSV